MIQIDLSLLDSLTKQKDVPHRENWSKIVGREREREREDTQNEAVTQTLPKRLGKEVVLAEQAE